MAGRIGELALQVRVLACQPEFNSWKPHSEGEKPLLQGVRSPPGACTVCKCLHTHKQARVRVYMETKKKKIEQSSGTLSALPEDRGTCSLLDTNVACLF